MTGYCCGADKALKVYKNYPTEFDDVDWLSVLFESEVIDLTNFEAQFILGSAHREWTDLTQGITINLSEEETGTLPVGLNYGTLIVTDTSGNSKPFSTAIPVEVLTWVEGNQELDTYNMTVNALLDNETQMVIKIETAKVSLDWVLEKIGEHNASEEAHPYIQGRIDDETTARENADNALSDRVDEKQDKLTSGNAGDGISIEEVGGVTKIFNTQTSAEWGNILGTLSDQLDLKQALDLKLPTSTKYGSSLSLSIDPTTFVVTVQLKDQDGNNLGQAGTIDLPLESVVVGGRYDDTTKKVILTLENGSTIEFSVADLVAGLQTEITAQNKLNADYVDDSNSANKFATTQEKATWNGKQDAINDLDTIRSGASAGATALQGVQVNGTDLTPDANKKVNVQVPTDTSDLTNGAGFLTSSALSDYVTTNTKQMMTAPKAITGTDVPWGSDQVQKNLFMAVSNSNTTPVVEWIGRSMFGANNLTFLMGTINKMAALGAHSWTSAKDGTGAAWADIYINPDGDKAVKIGGSPMVGRPSIMVIQNMGQTTTGTVKINRRPLLTQSALYKDVACWDDNVSKFTNDAGYITSSALNGYATEQWVGQQGYLTQAVDDDSTTSTTLGWSASKLNGIVGDIEATINAIRGV